MDGDFADEKVRGFAVRVLDTLPDEKLETFLLQLTQVLILYNNYTVFYNFIIIIRLLNLNLVMTVL